MRRETMSFKRRRKTMTIMYIAYILLLVIMGVGISSVITFNDHEYTVTITDKDRVITSDSSKYLVYTEDIHGNTMVFENTDCAMRLKFNSSNIQGQLKVGHTYKVTVIGYRVPFFSMYENILKIQEVNNG